jgi:hypothetical protein
MSARNFATAIVILTAMCTLLLFFCPVASGPYSATHGPVNVLKAMRDASTLKLGMLLAATTLIMSGLGFRSRRSLIPVTVSRHDRDRQVTATSSEMRC